jgi:hypothetical protein
MKVMNPIQLSLSLAGIAVRSHQTILKKSTDDTTLSALPRLSWTAPDPARDLRARRPEVTFLAKSLCATLALAAESQCHLAGMKTEREERESRQGEWLFCSPGNLHVLSRPPALRNPDPKSRHVERDLPSGSRVI